MDVSNLFDLKDKLALVTGSSRGLGLIFAEVLASAGAAVIINGQSKERVAESAGLLRAKGFTVYESAFDVTDKDQVEKAVAKIESEAGIIDILVNCAGIQRRAPFTEFEMKDFDEIMRVNVGGVFITSQVVAKSMIRKGAGKIINICSMMSELGRDTITAYAASKGAVKMITRNLAVELARHNIQVNGLGPGYFITSMTRNLAEDKTFNDWLCARTPAKRWGLPEEMAGTLILLASKASDFIDGQIFYVDGGILAAI
jgi:gluconate 5-dehydrogenase